MLFHWYESTLDLYPRRRTGYFSTKWPDHPLRPYYKLRAVHLTRAPPPPPPPSSYTRTTTPTRRLLKQNDVHMRSNDSFNFPLGLIKYIVIVIPRHFPILYVAAFHSAASVTLTVGVTVEWWWWWWWRSLVQRSVSRNVQVMFTT